MKIWVTRVSFLWLILLICACSIAGNESGSASSISPTETHISSTPTPSSLTTKINAAQRQWVDQNVTNYEIDIHFISYGTEIRTHVVVEDGQAIETSCEDETMFSDVNNQCDWFKENPARFTVRGLFSAARSFDREFRYIDGPPKDAPIVIFDPTYGYPRRVVWQLSEYTEWNVTKFEER